MKKTEYLAILYDLGLGIASQSTAEALGVTVRQIQYYASGEPIPETMAKLIRMYQLHPKDIGKV